ncbi:MAG: recombinase family protein [Clostridiales bacterium]|nr:recombinase family protein [Clostridiales bacterium]
MADNREREQIRQAYAIKDTDTPTRTIPATRKITINEDDRPLNVCAYCRVSTGNDEQLSSFVLQQEHYNQLAKSHKSWNLKHVYADEGISGTSLKHRNSFNEMIAACRRGEYDLIVTKSVSRFARNVVDCVSLVRELKHLNPPVGVFFETDSIYTLSEESELKLNLFASVAQAESEKKSESMNWSLNERFKHNKLLTPELYGYRRPRDLSGHYVKYGILEIKESEAVIVRFIFNAFLAGFTLERIAELLTEMKVKTKLGNTNWNVGSLAYIIRNERYCGSVLTWKTFTADIFEHKKRKNRHNRDQCYYSDHHPAIVSVETFEAAQSLIYNRRRGMRGGLHIMQVIDDGVFQGYVPINHRWANDDPNEYYNASESVEERKNDRKIRRSAFSAFDLTGYQVVRGQFLTARTELPCMTVSSGKIMFNTACGKKLQDYPHIQLLLHPNERKMAIRPCGRDDAFSIPWRKQNSEQPIMIKTLSCPFFIKALMQIMDWNPDFSYRISGTWIEKGTDCIIVFNLTKAMPIAEVVNEEERKSICKRRMAVCPEEWEDSFGDEFYEFSMDNELYYLKSVPNLNSDVKCRNVDGQQLSLLTYAEVLESAEKIKTGVIDADE